MEIDFFTVFLAVLLANILAGIIHINMMHFGGIRRIKRRKLIPIADKDFENLNIPPSSEVMESELDKHAEIMARALKILNKQIKDKMDGEIDLENPPR